MSYKYFASLIILLLILTACAERPVSKPSILPDSPNTPTTYPEPSTPIEPISPYPGPSMDTPQANLPAYPGPDASGTVPPGVPPSGYEPQPGDENLERGPVFLDLPNSRFSTPDHPTNEVEVILLGNLPDPCHSLRVVVNPPDENNVINLDAYSVGKPGEICITVLEPFTANIPLGSYSNGDYSVMVNGERLGEFSAESGTAPAVPVSP